MCIGGICGGICGGSVRGSDAWIGWMGLRQFSCGGIWFFRHKRVCGNQTAVYQYIDKHGSSAYIQYLQR